MYQIKIDLVEQPKNQTQKRPTNSNLAPNRINLKEVKPKMEINIKIPKLSLKSMSRSEKLFREKN